MERGTGKAGREKVTNEERKKGCYEGYEAGQPWEGGTRVHGHFKLIFSSFLLFF